MLYEFYLNFIRRTALKFRKKRMEDFERFYASTFLKHGAPAGKINILDLGGELRYWETVGFKYLDTANFVLLNLEVQDIPAKYKNMKSVAGDATDLSRYADKQFDLVFSNSVIEHVGDISAQKNMEPHYRVPFFEFLPFGAKTFLVRHFKMSGMPKAESAEEAVRIVNSIHLLTKSDVEKLFPEALIKEEKASLFTKSFYLYY